VNLLNNANDISNGVMKDLKRVFLSFLFKSSLVEIVLALFLLRRF
jgi:hypothetical protein